jgi:aminoglycoside phosphotransferase (APT) family kinase protein
MADASAQMLRAISRELTDHIIPNLSKEGDAIDRATYATQILQLMAADTDLLADLALEQSPAIRHTIEDVLTDLATSELAEKAARWRAQLNAIQVETDIASQREIKALRQLAADILREMSDSNSGKPEFQRLIARLGELDHHWLTLFADARNKIIQQNTTENQKQDAPATDDNDIPEVTVDTVTRYLKDRYPQSPAIEATRIISVPGGRSKKTWFIHLKGTEELPSELVMRQDYQLHYEGTKVKDEYRPLSKLASLNLPVPKPMLLEENASILGQPFMLMDKARGTPPGSYFGLTEKCPGAFEDLARLLAKLHSVNPAELGFTVGDDPENSLIRLIHGYKEKWRNNTLKPSPLIDYAFSWAEQVCSMDKGMVSPVHGDVGPHNMLVADNRLQAMLDWEFSHTGDPAEDLGIVKVYAEQTMEWKDFMAIYLKAGGRPVPERRIEMTMVLHYLKGACLVAVSGRNFEEEWTQEFIKGATAFAGLRQIEMIIAGQLKRFGAIKSL